MGIASLTKKSLTPLVAVNTLALVASGGWLISQGFITNLWISLLCCIFSPFLFPVLMIPGAMCAGLMHLFHIAKPGFAKFMGFLSIAYFVALFTLYTMLLVLSLDLVLATQGWVAGVYAVTVSLAPWSFLALKDRDNLFFIGLVWMAEIAAVSVVTLLLVHHLPFRDATAIFAAIMTLLLLVQSLLEKLFFRKPAQTGPAAPPAPPETPVT